jgi:excisionase family DNA binding protein
MGKIAPSVDSPVMTVEQAAVYLGYSVSGIYIMASEGRIPGFKLGNRWRFSRPVLDRWMDEQSNRNVVVEGLEPK